MSTKTKNASAIQQQLITRYLKHILKARNAATELSAVSGCHSGDFPDWKRCEDLEQATYLCYNMACGIQSYPFAALPANR